jgi:hypothetical protein
MISAHDKKWIKILIRDIEHPIDEALEILLNYCEGLEKKIEELERK